MEPAERDAQRRRRLLATALELFGTRGYLATPIEALCAQANVANRALYELFGSREAVLVTLYDEISAEVATGVATALGANPDDLRTHIRGGVAAFLEPLVTDERKGRIMQLEVIGISAEVERHRRAVIHRFIRLLDTELERLASLSLISPPVSPLVSLVMAGGITEVLVDHLLTSTSERQPPAHLVDEITVIWLAVL